MYAQIFLVTSVRGMVLPPQIFANASLSFFGAKMPFPDFFMAAASLLPFAFFAFLLVGFFVFVVATVVFFPMYSALLPLP